jgi:hypothetical protein
MEALDITRKTFREELKKLEEDEDGEDGENMYQTSTFTLTFGNRAENHKGMQIIGRKLDSGLSLEDLKEAQQYFENKDARTIMVNLKDYLPEEVRDEAEDAHILIVKGGVEYLVDSDDLYDEVEATPKDTKAFMYGRVVNKKARHNNCFSDFSQEPSYEEGKGTVINFTDVPLISRIREQLPTIIKKNEGVKMLQCEGNYYYDVEKTFIGFHGDSEREIVIAVRLGAKFNLYYQWYKDNQPVGELFKHTLCHGDIYFMSDKATGNDWKRKSIYTLRHAAARREKLVGL